MGMTRAGLVMGPILVAGCTTVTVTMQLQQAADAAVRVSRFG